MSYSKSKFCHFLFTLLVIAVSLGCWHYGNFCKDNFYKEFFLFIAGMNAATALQCMVRIVLDDY